MSIPPEPPYDALLVVSFGGPEGPQDVAPFLENVMRGRNLPRERMIEVARHYQRFGGKSPLNEQNRALVRTLATLLAEKGPRMPVYLGNRNWHPLLADTLRRMAGHGVKRALAFVTSAYSSYSSCRLYLENIEQARSQVGPGAPQVDKLRAFFDHPAFIEAVSDRAGEALEQVPPGERSALQVIYTAHSIPVAMAQNCLYEAQLEESCRLVSQRLEPYPWRLVYQSRSGPASQAWLGPDVRDSLQQLAAEKVGSVLIVPIGFLSDHIEVLYDLDVEACQLGRSLAMNVVRAPTPGTHPRFVGMVRELILERMAQLAEPALQDGICPPGCCLPESPVAVEQSSFRLPP